MSEKTKEHEFAETKPIRFTLTHYRKAGVTHEAFMKWIFEVHLPKAIPVFKKHGISGYAIFDTPAPSNDALRELMAVARPTWDVADFDCVIEYTGRSVQAMEQMMNDPEWIEVCRDQEDWVDTSRALVALGYHTKYLENGKMVNLE